MANHIVPCATLATCLALSGVAGCARPLATLESEIGQTTTKAVSLKPGASLSFPVSASWVDYDGAQYIMLHVELLRGGAVVETMDCRGYSFGRSSSGCGTGSTQSFADCKAVVPGSGADGIRVSTKLNAGTATVRGLAVLVEERQP